MIFFMVLLLSAGVADIVSDKIANTLELVFWVSCYCCGKLIRPGSPG